MGGLGEALKTMAAERRRAKATKSKPKTPKRAAAELAIEERRAKATKLRLAGWSMPDIAAHLGCSVGTVHSDLTAVLVRTREQANDCAELERELSVARIEVATKGIWPGIETGDVDAIDRLVKLEARRAKLLGLDAPAKQELSGPDGGPIDMGTITTLEQKLVTLGQRLAGGSAEPGGAPGAGSGSAG